MFWQAFICGMGGATGACIVFMAFALLFGLWNSKERTESFEIHRKSLDALSERNRLTEVQNTAIWRIVEALERTK